jgi:hypothetical protein
MHEPLYFSRMKFVITILILFVFCSCWVDSEEAQRHNNLIMVAQERVVEAFYQCDSSLMDSMGYRMFYWEYDSIDWNLKQMKQLLDTIQCPQEDTTLKSAARNFITASAELREKDYPLFLDAFRKYQALGQQEDSLAMHQFWNIIIAKKNKIIENFQADQKTYFENFDLTEHRLP